MLKSIIKITLEFQERKKDKMYKPNLKSEIIKQNNMCGKNYDICILKKYDYYNCKTVLTPRGIDEIPTKIYKNVELLNINGLGTGQVHFLTEKGEYILVPWSMIVWMLPSATHSSEMLPKEDNDLNKEKMPWEN